jgi:deoxyribodipyrimidine photolyase-related protein
MVRTCHKRSLPKPKLRHRVLVLGDQLDPATAALEGGDPARDRFWMVEVPGKAP